MAAGAILHLLLSYEKAQDLNNAICYVRADPFSSIVKRVRDYREEELRKEREVQFTQLEKLDTKLR